MKTYKNIFPSCNTRKTKVYIKVNKAIEILQKEYPDPDKSKSHPT